MGYTMAMSTLPQSDYDSPWKDALAQFLPDALALFFPDAYEDINLL